MRVNAGDTQTVELKNTALQSVTIIKRADDSGEYTTREDGTVTVSGLRPGMTIIAQEVRTVKGYTLNTERKTIVVGDGSSGQTTAASGSSTGAAGTGTGKTTTLTVENTPYSGIEIHKVDSITGAGIYGAKFLLYDAEKHPLGEYVSDQDGFIHIDNLTRDGT